MSIEPYEPSPSPEKRRHRSRSKKTEVDIEGTRPSSLSMREVTARIREADAAHRRKVDLLSHGFVFLVLFGAGLISLIACFLPSVPEDGRKVASQVVFSIITGCLSFALGRRTGKEK